MWGTKTPQVKDKSCWTQTADMKDVEPKNLEEQAIKLIGPDIYEKLIKGYWKTIGTFHHRPPHHIYRKRLPVRLTFDNCFFNDRYQNSDRVSLQCRIVKICLEMWSRAWSWLLCQSWRAWGLSWKVVFTGMIDQYFDYKHGEGWVSQSSFEDTSLGWKNHQEMP